jgi:acetyl-CoA decarbonylase/synthase complex subunit delta
MAVNVIKERNTGSISTVVLGATKDQGGTRANTITVGGETCLPFMQFEGEIPNKPIIAMEVVDRVPTEWSTELKSAFKGVIDSPAAWAKKCVEEWGADMIALKLQSADPDLGIAVQRIALKLSKMS